MPKRITKKIGEYAVHKYLNNGIGIILSRDDERSTLKFEDEKVGTYPSASVVELTLVEALKVRIIVANMKICNRKIRDIRTAKATGSRVDKDSMDAVRISRDIARLKGIFEKEHDHLKESYGIDYKVEN